MPHNIRMHPTGYSGRRPLPPAGDAGRSASYREELVVAEASAGDRDAAERRAQIIRDMQLLSIPDEAVALAEKLVEAAGLPTRAAADALHISIAACHGIDYLLTWNLTYIANAEFRPKVERACRDNGFEPPVLCTPDELMGG